MKSESRKQSGGTILINGVVFTYRISKASVKKAEYSSVINVYIIDPETGCRMQDPRRRSIECEKLKEKITTLETAGPIFEMKVAPLQKRLKLIEEGTIKYDIVSSTYIKESEETPAKIKALAYKCAEKLYKRYESELLNKFKEKPEIGRLNSNQLYQRYGKDFIASLGGQAKGTIDNKRRALETACMNLPSRPILDLQNSDIEKMFKIKCCTNNKALISNFFEYCRNQKAYLGVNPIINYLDKFYVAKPTGKKLLYPEHISHLPLDIEIRLHNLISENLDDREIMAIILAKCFGMPLNQILTLHWNAISEINGSIVIYCNNNSNVGSFHDFTRPILREGSDFIKEKIKRLLQSASREELNSRSVVPIKIDKRSNIKSGQDKKAHLTRYIRNMLIAAGMTTSEINSSDPGTRIPGGSGISLLHKHYNYVLEERCGVTLDSDDGKYLRGLVPGNTTQSYYRSMSDSVSGIPYFLTIVRRDDIFAHFSNNVIARDIDVKTENGITIITIPSYGPGQRLCLTIPRTYIPKGTKIIIKSNYGICGDIQFRTQEDSNANDFIEVKRLY